MSKMTKKRRTRPSSGGKPTGATRQRVSQETIDEMARLRRQGLTCQKIGQRVGCGERTVRRYVKQVLPQLHLPQGRPEPKVEDPRKMRERLARGFSEALYRSDEYPRPRASVAFLAEGTRLIEEKLDRLPSLTLELMTKDSALRGRFLVETVGALYQDYRSYVRLECQLGPMMPDEAAARWHPLNERPELQDEDDEEL